MPSLALLARIEAKPGKEDALAELLSGALALAKQEHGTVTWYAFRLGPSTFGIFDTFANEPDRTLHLEGKIPAALMARADELLAHAPSIEKVDLLASKLSI